MTDSRMKLILIPDADGAASSFKRDHGVLVYCLIKSTGLFSVGTLSKLL